MNTRGYLLLACLGFLPGCGTPPTPLPALNASYEQALARTAPLAVILTPGSDEERLAFNRVQRYFTGMTAASVREQTSLVYAPESYLNDTLVAIEGSGNIEAYFAHTAGQVRTLNVEFLERATVGTDWYGRWQMTVVADGLNSGQPILTYGVTQFRFDAQGRILIHKDFWDAGSGLYEQLPILGGVIRRVRGAVEAAGRNEAGPSEAGPSEAGQ
ncbi:MAG: nuclear transport factor 2 family protein [Gammaproteobacteria bacterium]|nr:nuclear transport factor 2 family protein [Gammaproteobacteria bacterium]